MQSLLEILKVARQTQTKGLVNRYIAEQKDKDKGKLALFLTGLDEGNFKNDRDACLKLYGKDSDVKYNMLKLRLKHVLLEAVYLSYYEMSNENIIENVIDKLKKMLLIAFTIYSKGFNHTALDLYRYIFRQACKYYLYDILLEASGYLLTLSAYFNKVLEFTKLVNTIAAYKNFQAVEMELQLLIAEEKMKFFTGSELEDSFMKQQQKLAYFDSCALQIDNPNYKLDIILYKHFLNAGNKDYNKMESLLKDARKIIDANTLLVFKDKELQCMCLEIRMAILQQDLKTAGILLERYRSVADSTSMWIDYLFLKIIYLLHTHSYEAAYQQLLAISHHPLLNELPTVYLEHLFLFKKTFYILHQAALVKDIKSDILSILNKRIESNLIIQKKQKAFLIFLDLICALCNKNVKLACTYLYALKELKLKQNGAIVMHNRFEKTVAVITTFVALIKNKNSLTENLRINIAALKTNDWLDEQELLSYQAYLHCVEIIYSEASERSLVKET